MISSFSLNYYVFFYLFNFLNLLQREELEAALVEAQASFLGERSQWAGEWASLTSEVNFIFFICILIINLFVDY